MAGQEPLRRRQRAASHAGRAGERLRPPVDPLGDLGPGRDGGFERAAVEARDDRFGHRGGGADHRGRCRELQHPCCLADDRVHHRALHGERDRIGHANIGLDRRHLADAAERLQEEGEVGPAAGDAHTPAAIGERTDFSNQQDGDLNRYSQMIRDLAKKNGLPLIDLRKSFLDYNLKNNPNNDEKNILTTDRVHLNDAGNQLVADEMWKVLKGM